MEENVKSLVDYLEIAKRRKYYFILPFGVIVMGAVLAALLLPPVYRSEGTILVESQQIPTDFIRSTITSYAEERIQLIQQRVMTRDNLLKIREKHHLFEDEAGRMAVSQIIEKMRAQIFVELVGSDIEGASRWNRRTHTLAFRVAYEGSLPEVARDVANELVTLFLHENLKARTERATQTTDFLVSEAEKLKIKMISIEEQVAKYKQQHKDSLPENLNLNILMLERAQESQKELERDIKSEEEHLSYLEVELASLEFAIAPLEPGETITPEQNLAELNVEYVRLSAVYGPAHPDIRKLKRQIASLEEQVLPSSSNVRGGRAGSHAEMLVRARISASNSKTASYQKQYNNIQQRIKLLQERILTTPQVELGFKVLERDYENVKGEYEELKAKATDAQLSQSMEEQSKAERFLLLEPPLLPEKPVKPNRSKILLMGLILAIGGGMGAVFLKEEQDRSIRGSLHLVRIIKDTPLITIPYIETKEDIARQKRNRVVIIMVMVTVIVLGLTLIHFYYKPLDIIWYKVLHRVGIE